MKSKGVGIESIPLNVLTHFASLRGRAIQPSGVLPDWAIREFITIDDFIDYDESKPGTISYGLTSAGYDIRVGYKFKVFTNAECATVDPKNMSQAVFRNFDLTPEVHDWKDNPNQANGSVFAYPYRCNKCGDTCADRDMAMSYFCVQKPDHILIPPNSFALAETIERLYIPRNVVCWCIGKSTYARCGINMNFTPFEPGWWGIVTVEIINATPLPVKIYAGEGIGQAEFFLMAGEPEKSYGDKKNAKYQGQTGLTLPSVK